MTDASAPQKNATPAGHGRAGPAGAGMAQGALMPRVQILAQYVRDLSFENALAQQGAVLPPGQPDIQVKVSLDAFKREAPMQSHSGTQANLFEVATKYQIEARALYGGTPLFLVELDYAGLFQIEGIPQEQLHPFLLVECPRILFPFARRIIADVTRDGGFPSLNLELIDFFALYRQELLRQKQASPSGVAGVSPEAPPAA